MLIGYRILWMRNTVEMAGGDMNTPIKGSHSVYSLFLWLSYRWATPAQDGIYKGAIKGPWTGRTLIRIPPVLSKQRTIFLCVTVFYSKFSFKVQSSDMITMG